MQRARAFFFVCAGIFLLALSYHLGAEAAAAQAPLSGVQDVAVLSGVLNDGEIIPLPTYRDGTTALESDCSWTVSGNEAYDGESASSNHCFTEGRTVRVYNDCCGGHEPGKANYMIVAIERVQATANRSQSWGQLKARYR